jgi:hypothetical protein
VLEAVKTAGCKHSEMRVCKCVCVCVYVCVCGRAHTGTYCVCVHPRTKVTEITAKTDRNCERAPQ